MNAEDKIARNCVDIVKGASFGRLTECQNPESSATKTGTIAFLWLYNFSTVVNENNVGWWTTWQLIWHFRFESACLGVKIGTWWLLWQETRRFRLDERKPTNCQIQTPKWHQNILWRHSSLSSGRLVSPSIWVNLMNPKTIIFGNHFPFCDIHEELWCLECQLILVTLFAACLNLRGPTLDTTKLALDLPRECRWRDHCPGCRTGHKTFPIIMGCRKHCESPERKNLEDPALVRVATKQIPFPGKLLLASALIRTWKQFVTTAWVSLDTWDDLVPDTHFHAANFSWIYRISDGSLGTSVTGLLPMESTSM